MYQKVLQITAQLPETILQHIAQCQTHTLPLHEVDNAVSTTATPTHLKTRSINNIHQ
jgi:hypothetical protein